MVEASPKKVYANAHAYHVNSIRYVLGGIRSYDFMLYLKIISSFNVSIFYSTLFSVNSDNETYLSADDLRVNLWHLEITDRSFSKYNSIV